MSVFINWIWPVETDDEKLARWQALYKFDYSSKNNWKKVKKDDEDDFKKKDDEDDFKNHFMKKWARETISTDVNTATELKNIQILIGHNNKKYEKERKTILTKGFKAFQYGVLFTYKPYINSI